VGPGIQEVQQGPEVQVFLVHPNLSIFYGKHNLQ
jgi:hypothetical protein